MRTAKEYKDALAEAEATTGRIICSPVAKRTRTNCSHKKRTLGPDELKLFNDFISTIQVAIIEWLECNRV